MYLPPQSSYCKPPFASDLCTIRSLWDRITQSTTGSPRDFVHHETDPGHGASQ